MAKTKITSLENMSAEQKIRYYEFRIQLLTRERDGSNEVVREQREVIRMMEDLIGIYRRKLNILLDNGINGIGPPERWVQRGTAEEPFELDEVWDDPGWWWMSNRSRWSEE